MALLLGPKGPTVADEGCSSPQELEKADRRAAIFLVSNKDIKNIFGWARRAPLLGQEGSNVAAEGCSSPQELEKADRRAAIFLVLVKKENIFLQKKLVKLFIAWQSQPWPPTFHFLSGLHQSRHLKLGNNGKENKLNFLKKITNFIAFKVKVLPKFSFVNVCKHKMQNAVDNLDWL